VTSEPWWPFAFIGLMIPVGLVSHVVGRYFGRRTVKKRQERADQ